MRRDLSSLELSSLELETRDAYFDNEVKSWLDGKRTEIEESVLVSYDFGGVTYPSRAHTYNTRILSRC